MPNQAPSARPQESGEKQESFTLKKGETKRGITLLTGTADVDYDMTLRLEVDGIELPEIEVADGGVITLGETKYKVEFAGGRPIDGFYSQDWVTEIALTPYQEDVAPEAQNGITAQVRRALGRLFLSKPSGSHLFLSQSTYT